MKNKQKVEFYDSHPGLLGAGMKLPEQIRKAADKLAGKRLTLDEAVKKLQPAAEKLNGELRVINKDNFIMFYLSDGINTHAYRLIRYR